MESIGDILQGLARQRGRGDSGPLILWHPIAATEGARVSHVPISQHLSHAWVKLTGEPFRPHQSLALATLRRGDAIALSGASAAGAATARLLLFELLRAEPGATALILLPDLQMAREQIALLQPLNEELGNTLTIATVGPSGNVLHAARANIILTTPEVLHSRLLRYHDRIWQSFWRGLRVIWLAEAHSYTGVAAAHLGALLLRGSRLRGTTTSLPQLIATLADVTDAEATLAALWGAPWRLIAVDDTPTPPTTLAVWRGSTERLRDSATLAQAFVRAGYRVHLTCVPLDEQALRQLAGDDTELLTISTLLEPAEVQLLVGFPRFSATLRRALASGAEATVLVLGDQPCDTMLARLPGSLLTEPAPAWPAPPPNVYVTLQHLLCAANEQPLTGSEVDSWEMQPLIERMMQQRQLVTLPGSQAIWQPYTPRHDQPGHDPYAGFGLQAAGGLPTQLIGDGGQLLDQMDATAFDRWGYPGAVLPPGGSRYRVTGRNEERSTLTLRPEVSGRRTFPLRRCQVTVRDEREQRTLAGGRALGWGRVQVNEEIYGYREVKPSGQPAERTVSPPLTISWAAHGLWIDVGITPATNGQSVGWSLVHALPLRAGGLFTDVVPVYDVESRRLFLVDAQPGGNGLAAWAYAHLEELLPLAYDIALDCRNDPLLEPSARADMDWLLLLLGGEAQRALVPERHEQRSVEQPVYANNQGSREQPVARTANPVPRREPSVPPPPPPPQRQSVPPAPTTREVAPPVPPAPPIREVAPPAPEPAPTAPVPPAPREEPAKPAKPAASSKKSGGRRGGEGRKGRQAASTQPAERNGAAPKAAKQPAAPPPPDDDPLPPLPAEPPAPAVEQPAPPVVRPDASAMIAKMRQIRQQREQQEPRPTPSVPQQVSSSAETRFHAGDTVFCLPYGEGVVQTSRIENDGEILEVAFPDYGPLTIDPAISLVRLVASAVTDEDDDSVL